MAVITAYHVPLPKTNPPFFILTKKIALTMSIVPIVFCTLNDSPKKNIDDTMVTTAPKEESIATSEAPSV